MIRFKSNLYELTICLGAGLLAYSSLSYAKHFQRPGELEIHRPSLSGGHCTGLTFRTTQTHKALEHSDIHVIEGKLVEGNHATKEIGGFYERAYSYDLASLWDRAISTCGSLASWSFPSYIAPDVKSALPLQFQSLYSDGASQDVFFTVDAPEMSPSAPILEIVPIIQTGDPENRIDFVFLGDGYTSEERDKFLHDARRLAFDLSENQTFATVKPLLNFWAAFSPSNESGIGVGGEPKDTPFGLYRDGTELRAVYYSKPDVAQATCLVLGTVCDYPILLGNDPLYGGLGGRFTVTTSSDLNGALVLRHELGHSVIREGEEYDGGFNYYGPNAANLTEPFKWSHWLTNSSLPPREERSIMPMQAYPWTILNTTDPWTVSFNSSGTYSRHVIRFSLSGLPDAQDLIVTLDEDDLQWQPKVGISLDRWHYDIHRNEPLDGGAHNLSFSLRNASLAGVAQLCSVEIIEFGNENEFNNTQGYIGAFPTWSDKNQTSYRPTNEDCLMRIVTTPSFCKVCIEGLWHELLSRVNLIDDISLRCSRGISSQTQRTISLHLVGLVNKDNRAGYLVRWSKNGSELPKFSNKTSISVEDERATYAAHVQFVTDEVKVDPHGYLQASVEINVPHCESGDDNEGP